MGALTTHETDMNFVGGVIATIVSAAGRTVVQS